MKRKKDKEQQEDIKNLLAFCSVVLQMNARTTLNIHQRQQAEAARQQMKKMKLEDKKEWKGMHAVLELEIRGLPIEKGKLKQAYMDYQWIVYLQESKENSREAFLEKMQRKVSAIEKAIRLDEYSICHAVTSRRRNELYQHREKLKLQMEAIRERRERIEG